MRRPAGDPIDSLRNAHSYEFAVGSLEACLGSRPEHSEVAVVVPAMMEPTEGEQVGEVGGTAQGPMPDVVAFGAPGRHPAAGEATAPIAAVERHPHPGRDHARRTAH